MGKELALKNETAKQIEWANRLAGADMLPGQFRGRPGNLIWAAEFAKSLNVHPMVAVTGIHVIDGKPSASGHLISALVRRAGHKLRVRGNNRSATVEIIRHDDPDFVFTVTWELTKNDRGNPSAEDAGLIKVVGGKITGKTNWVNYPASMLVWRALTQCARWACEEALMGIHYTPEELDPNKVITQEGVPVHVERMDTISYEDMLAERILAAPNMDALAQIHKDASLGGVLASIPAQELDQGNPSPRTLLKMLNDKAKEITERESASRSEGTERADESGGQPYSEGERGPAAGTGGSGTGEGERADLTPETDYDSELIEAEVEEDG